MSIDQLSVCADVGGTFTDCLAFWTDSSGRPRRGCIKVLSTGLIRCAVTAVQDGSTIQVEIPAELVSELCDGRMPNGFFRTAKLQLLIDGISHFVGYVGDFDSNESIITLDEFDSQVADKITPGALVEIDCGLEAPVLATRLLVGIPIDVPLPPMTARLGTTRGTNALLTRSGANLSLIHISEPTRHTSQSRIPSYG